MNMVLLTQRRDEYHWRVDMLDIGHGLAVVIEREGKPLSMTLAIIGLQVIWPLLSFYRSLNGVALLLNRLSLAMTIRTILAVWLYSWMLFRRQRYVRLSL